MSEGLEAIIGVGWEEISAANLAKFPSFLRFDYVLLQYFFGTQSILAKCRFFEECLNSIKPALKDSNNICFQAYINQANPTDFGDHASLVAYLRDRLLPICSSSRRYSFIITSEYGNSATEVISSILQFPQVRLCSNVFINLLGYCLSIRLPVDDISNWLVPKTDDGVDICGKNGENRFLRIFSYIIPNTQKMWDHLMEVNFNFGIKIKFVLKKIRILNLLVFIHSLHLIFFHFYDYFYCSNLEI